MPTNESRPLAIIGPSGCGKSSVLQLLAVRDLVHITPTWTDRPRRAGEAELEHRFVSAAEFSQRADRGEFTEVVQPFGLPYRYGLPPLSGASGRAAVTMIRAPFVSKFRQYYPRGLVYQIEAAYEFAQAVLLKRSPDGHGTRLSAFEDELQAGRQLADRTFHNRGEALSDLAETVIMAMKRDGLIAA